MNLTFPLGLAAALALPVQALAACVDGETLFACTTTKGKQVEVGGRQVTSLECRAETLVNNLEGVALREVE